MIYRYQCEKCGEILNIHYGLKEDKPQSIMHAECGGVSKRLFSSPNVLYRGSGFYKTDKVLLEPTKDEIYDAENPGYQGD